MGGGASYDFTYLQDPYFPQQPPKGPSFLDTEACLCALQTTPDKSANATAWQCIGNQTDGVYTVKTGKWFATLPSAENTGPSVYAQLPIDDASIPLDTSQQLRYDNSSSSLVTITSSDSSLSVQDKACTGRNQTTFSTAFYRAAEEQKENETMVDAAPCWREGAIPIQIQNLTSWQDNGCNGGFLCANNTVNSLPQSCPPLTACLESRMSGQVCTLNGTNVAMGPFEPVICQAGFYCPKGANTTEMIKCPAGSYCQPGAATPTPCTAGSICPKGSQYQRFMAPLIILIIIDLAIAIGLVVLRLRKRRSQSSKTPGPSKAATIPQRAATLNRRATLSRRSRGYSQLGGGPETDTTELAQTETTELTQMDSAELAEMDPEVGIQRVDSEKWIGFEAALALSQRYSQIAEKDIELAPQLRVFIDSMRKATDATHFGLSFGYTDLSFQPKGSPAPILQNVSGSIERGNLVAVMGGSGAGKSTFVNVLMGKTTNTGGLVMINNVPGRVKRYKKLIGYVPQDDIVLPELTVYENILHSARIRLPNTWADNDIEAHVNSVIDCLELSHVRDSLVGSVGKPVISGGQRKRVSIGLELAAAPMAIFLDEPTSGLDATSAVSIMRTLKAIARLGISVIVVIHQPRKEIFETLDDLILLASGQIVYEGREADVQNFFQDAGFTFPKHANRGDIVTDIITGNGRAYKPAGDVSKEALIANWAISRQNAEVRKKRTSAAMSLAPSVQSGSVTAAPSICHESVTDYFGDRPASVGDFDTKMHEALKTRGASRPKQIRLCLRRALLQQWRTKSNLFFELGLASLAGILLGLAQSSKKGVLFRGIYVAPYQDLSTATDMISAPVTALLMAIAIGLVAAAPGVRNFSEELLVHRREAEAGHSRLAYYLAKTACVVPRMLLCCFHLTTLVMVLLVPVMGWAVAFVTNMAYFYCVFGLAAAVSMVSRRADAPLLATMLALIVGILSGAAPPLARVQAWGAAWLWRASPATWLAEVYFGRLVGPSAGVYDTALAARATGFHLGRFGLNVVVMLAIGTVYRGIAFAALVKGERLRA